VARRAEPPTPPPTKGERTRQALLAAAIARFGRDGYRATSLAEIARDAQLSSTAAYPYFANKEALFVAAVDEDAAGVIDQSVLRLLQSEALEWLDELLPSLLTALDRHPLARRVLKGLEPEFTVRLLDIPALGQLRKVVADRIEHQQHAGLARADIDPTRMAEGMITIVISLTMALVQTGADPTVLGGPQARTVLLAALTAPPAPPTTTVRRRR
jgi:AcrR family transcriptional regulator